MSNQISDDLAVKTTDSDNYLQSRHPEIKNLMAHTALDANTSTICNQLKILKNSLEDVSEVNEARVLYFKAEIQLGHYQIDNDQIAMKMLNAELA